MSKLSINIDKKQMPQVVGLGVLSLGLAGYFSMRLLTPSGPAGVASAAATVGTRSVVSANPGAVVGVLPADASTVDLTNGPAPILGMRDPFVPLVTDESGAAASAPVKMASALTEPGSLTPVPGLPSAGSVQPLPGFPGAGKPGTLIPLAAPIAAPTWTVTGVLCGNDPDAGSVAVLRQGDVRRFVHLGSMVDEQYRLIDVSRTGVILGVGKTHFRLPLGGAPKTPSAPAASAPAASAPATGTANAGSASVPVASSVTASATVPAPSALPANASVTPPSPAADPANDPFLDSVAAGKGPL